MTKYELRLCGLGGSWVGVAMTQWLEQNNGG